MLLLTNAVILLYEAGLVYVITTDSFNIINVMNIIYNLI